MNKVKILVIHQDGLITGSGKSLRFLLKGLDPLQFEVQAILGGPGPLEKLLADDGFTVIIFRLYGFWTAPGPKCYRPGAIKNLLSFFRNKGIVTLVKRIDPHIIHLNDKALVSVGLTLRRLGKPIVQHLRSTYQATHVRPFIWISKWAIQKYASLLVSISEDEAEEFNAFSKKVVIFNSIDTQAMKFSDEKRAVIRRQLGIAKDETVILFIGLFTETKGAWDFIDMVGYYKANFGVQKLRFVMVGPLPQSSEANARTLQSKLRANNLTNEIIFPGYRNDILEVIYSAEVAVICNRLGAMGRQAFEVLSVGIPLLITGGHSGKSTIVMNKKSGVVVKAGDYRAMAAELKNLIENPALMQQFSLEGRRHAENHFDYRVNGRLLEVEYLKLVKGIS